MLLFVFLSLVLSTLEAGVVPAENRIHRLHNFSKPTFGMQHPRGRGLTICKLQFPPNNEPSFMALQTISGGATLPSLKNSEIELDSVDFFSTRKLDARIFRLFLPAVLNFAVLPLVSAVDTYWIGYMRDAKALAASGAANQVGCQFH